MALPLILFLLLGLTVLGHGALLLSLQDLRATWAFRGALQGQGAGKAAIHLAMDVLGLPSGPRTPGERIPLVKGETEDGFRYRGGVRWLDREFFLLEGEGGAPAWEGERRTAVVGWSLDPVSRLGALSAFAETGGGVVLQGAASPTMAHPGSVPRGWEAVDCAPFEAVMDSVLSTGIPDVVGPLEEPESYWARTPRPIPSLGLLSGSRLLALGTSTRPLPLPPAPGSGARMGGCPPGAEPGFFGTSGSVTLTEGRFCGLMVVAGDLGLAGSARFQGLAVVGGEMVLEEDAAMEGIARVGGRIRLSGSAVFEGSFCPVFWALKRLTNLQKPLFIDGIYLNGF